MSDKNTETLDKLYLEWAQFTSARTWREIDMAAMLRTLRQRLDAGKIPGMEDSDLIRGIDAMLARMDSKDE